MSQLVEETCLQAPPPDVRSTWMTGGVDEVHDSLPPYPPPHTYEHQCPVLEILHLHHRLIQHHIIVLKLPTVMRRVHDLALGSPLPKTSHLPICTVVCLPPGGSVHHPVKDQTAVKGYDLPLLQELTGNEACHSVISCTDSLWCNKYPHTLEAKKPRIVKPTSLNTTK